MKILNLASLIGVCFLALNAAACSGGDDDDDDGGGSGGSSAGTANSAAGSGNAAGSSTMNNGGTSSTTKCDEAACAECAFNASSPAECADACKGCDVSGTGGTDPGTGGSSPTAGGPATAGKMLGESCDYDSDCESKDCPFGLSYCTQGCDDFSDCPAFWECKSVGASAQKVCQK